MEQSTNNGGTTTEDKTLAIIAKDDGEFVKLITQRYMYKPETCKEYPLVGFLLNRLPMPPINKRPWDAFLIRLTRPTKAIDRDDNLVDVGVGDEVLIPATFILASTLSKAATDAEKVYEIRIQPTKTIDVGGGQEMWEYDLAAKPNPRPRKHFGLAAAVSVNQSAPQLIDGNGQIF
jgi:hypothetical protein